MTEDHALPESLWLRRMKAGLSKPITEQDEVEGRWIYWEEEFREIVGLWDQEKKPGYVKATSSTHSGFACVSLQDPDVALLSVRAGELLKKGLDHLHLRELEELEGELA